MLETRTLLLKLAQWPWSTDVASNHVVFGAFTGASTVILDEPDVYMHPDPHSDALLDLSRTSILK